MNEHQKPSFLKITSGFAKELIKYAAEGFPAVTPEEFNHRVEICVGCDWFNVKSEKCNHCGCPIKNRASWRSADCPTSKWPKLK